MFKQPPKHPAAFMRPRKQLPKHLYIVINDVTFPTMGGHDGAGIHGSPSNFFAKHVFSWNDLTKKMIEEHLKYKTSGVEASSFISTYEIEATALEYPPFSPRSKHKGKSRGAATLILATEGLVQAWATTTTGAQIPIWIEQGALPKVPKGVFGMTPEGFDAFESSAWICLEEVRVAFGLKKKDYEQGEWLACGHIPSARVCGQVLLNAVKMVETELVYEEMEHEELKKRQVIVEAEKKNVKHSGASPPRIPIRASSLRSFKSDNDSQKTLRSSKSARLSHRRSPSSGDARIVRNAQSLIKQALLASMDDDKVTS